jgi:hypothetical protein
MPELPGSLLSLLSLLRPALSASCLDTFCWLAYGFIARVGEHTVTGMWQAARLAGRLHHSRAHDFFARRRWDPDQLGLRLLDFLVSVLLAPDAPLVLAIDDTLFGRSGRRVFGAHYLHDGSQPAGEGKRTRWGNCWVKLGLVVCLPCLGGRSVCLPILLRLFRPKTDEQRDRPSQPELARALVELIAARFPGRRLELLFDGAYAAKAWRGLEARVTLTTRMRSNAALYGLAPARTGKRGRPPLKGARLGSLAQIAAAATFKPVTVSGPDGSTRVEHAHELVCLWYGPFHTRAVKLVLIRAPERSEGYVALATTDLDAAAARVIGAYERRWTIETSIQEGKANGAGEARNRTERAVLRTVPFNFLCQTITIAWYQLHGDPERDLATRRRRAPWYRHKQTISYADMLAALRRELIRAEYRAQAAAATTKPKSPSRRSPSALAAA